MTTRTPPKSSSPEASHDPAAIQNPKSENPKSTLRLSNPSKVFWPEEGYTKFDLARFYDMVFPRLKPHVKDRLLSLERCPDGIQGQCFVQKEKPPGMPEDTPTKAVKHEKGTTNYVVGGKLETQLALVNLGCIAVHVWGSRAADPRKPDWVCFDLDPDSGAFADAAKRRLEGEGGARRARPRLLREDLGQEGDARLRPDPRRAGYRRGPRLRAGARRAPGGGVSRRS